MGIQNNETVSIIRKVYKLQLKKLQTTVNSLCRKDLPYFVEAIQNNRKMALIRIKGGSAIGDRIRQIVSHGRRHNFVHFSMPQMDFYPDVIQAKSPGPAI